MLASKLPYAKIANLLCEASSHWLVTSRVAAVRANSYQLAVLATSRLSPATPARGLHIKARPVTGWCLPLFAPGSCASAAAKLRTQGGGPAAPTDTSAMNTLTRTHSDHQCIDFIHYLHLAYTNWIPSYKLWLNWPVRLYTCACWAPGLCEALQWGEIIYSPSRTSWCHPWHPAARWWTPGSVWLSGEASPSPQSVRSFLEDPLCIRATPL